MMFSGVSMSTAIRELTWATRTPSVDLMTKAFTNPQAWGNLFVIIEIRAGLAEVKPMTLLTSTASTSCSTTPPRSRTASRTSRCPQAALPTGQCQSVAQAPSVEQHVSAPRVSATERERPANRMTRRRTGRCAARRFHSAYG